MTAIVTWNIQNGKGLDGVIDLARIAADVQAMGEADVVCLQEVARNDPEFGAADQVAELGRLFAGYEVLFGAALRRQEGRAYGNVLLSRRPILQAFNHLLPYPAEAGTKHMQRQAIEAVVQTRAGPLRVMTAHLEFYSARQRAAQVQRLRELQEEAAAHEKAPATPDRSPYDLVPRPASLVLCGDFNLLPDDADYKALFKPPLVDAWSYVTAAAKHPPTFDLHGSYGRGPECRDYFVVSQDVAARVQSVVVDAVTQASDHQPVRLVLRD